MQLSCLSVAVSASNASTTSSSRSSHITACFESGEEQDLGESHGSNRDGKTSMTCEFLAGRMIGETQISQILRPVLRHRHL